MQSSSVQPPPSKDAFSPVHFKNQRTHFENFRNEPSGVPEPLLVSGKSVHDACCTAYQEIDLREHEGGHPRLGAVDLVPFHPVSESVTLDECGIFARGTSLRSSSLSVCKRVSTLCTQNGLQSNFNLTFRKKGFSLSLADFPVMWLIHSAIFAMGVSDVANQLSESVPGMSAFLFGAADLPLRRGLVERRKHLGWFSGKHGSEFDNIQQDIGARPSSRYGCTGGPH